LKHALVVGGTGMLSYVTLWLIDNGYHVSVIARNPTHMKKLIDKAKNETKVTPILVDYTNGKDLRENLNQTIKFNGNINIVIAWIHTVAEDALEIISQEVSNRNNEWALFHVLGSSSNLKEIKRKLSIPGNCLYHQVQLGFVFEGNHSRWLTNKEISNGIIEAIKRKKRILVVGTIEPWEKRP
jgi:NAD(P)-dependent dehydrogenase (short-subunit alcohol dehydrogenase family)